MISKIKSFGINGIEGYIVDVEIDIRKSLPGYVLVGLPDTSIKESKERVHSAIINCGIKFPIGKIVINLAPADTRKEGVIYDLPIALGILAAAGQVDERKLHEFAFVGELSLNGEIRKINGVLPILIAARANGVKKIIIPTDNAEEASFIAKSDESDIDCVEVFTADNLLEVLKFFGAEIGADNKITTLPHVEHKSFDKIREQLPYSADLKYVKGQYIAKRALEIAAAGGHNLLLIGPPGSGKTMMAKCFPTILPDLTYDESIEVTKIHSIAGVLDAATGMVVNRPFRTPHHTASLIALAGGGKNAKPGEISLAHNGVLFLDELPEYPRSSLEMLRQPLEDNKITIARVAATVDYPAAFTLIASMNPCPCGHHGSRTQRCTCTPTAINKYLARLSGPLMDRIDLHIEVDNVTYDDLTTTDLEESSAAVKERVDGARKIQLTRFEPENNNKKTKVFCNAKMTTQQAKRYCKLSSEGQRILKEAFEKLQLSARAYTRILRVARTIADLDASADINVEHIQEAVGYRSLDRK